LKAKKKELKRLSKIVKNIFETRKAIDSCLEDKRSEIFHSVSELKGDELDVSVWNDLGLFFLEHHMNENAELIYRHMLNVAFEVERRINKRIHKGLPLYNMGVAQINMRNFDEGIPNILRAYEEDILKFGEEKAKEKLASKLKEGFLEFISKVIDNNYLKEFNTTSKLNIKTSYDLIANMNEVEKLFLAKIITSKKLVTFHDDAYTKVIMFDNLRNLCLMLEWNLKRRSNRKDSLSLLIPKVFSFEKWAPYFKSIKLKTYSSISEFESKLDQIEKTNPLSNTADNFILQNFFTTTLVRNFTAHYLDEKITLLSDPQKYDRTFAREIYALLYT